MMTVCSDGHDEIVYDGEDCPLCETLERLNDRDDDCTRAEERVGEVEAELAEVSEVNLKLHARVEGLEKDLDGVNDTIDDLNQEIYRGRAEVQRLMGEADRRP